MADDDWRARRAAELLGPSFERPAMPARPARPAAPDETWPISRPAVVPRTAQPVAASPRAGAAAAVATHAQAPRGTSGRRLWAWANAAVLLLVGAVALFLIGRRQPVPVPVIAPSMAIPPQLQHSPVAATASPVAPVAPIAPLPEATIVEPAAPAVPETIQPARPRSHRAVAKPPAKARPDRQAAAAKRKPAIHHRSSKARAAIVTANPGTATPAAVAATTAAAPVLPICQPDDYSRAPRPCRPSHLRAVRKPFFEN